MLLLTSRENSSWKAIFAKLLILLWLREQIHVKNVSHIFEETPWDVIVWYDAVVLLGSGLTVPKVSHYADKLAD